MWKGPYQTDIVGVDEEGPQLYMMDYSASLQKVNKVAHGYGAMFTFSLMGRYYKGDLSLEEAKHIIRKRTKELEVRFVMDLGKYASKVVDRRRQDHRLGRLRRASASWKWMLL